MATPEDGYPIAKFTYLEDGFYQVVQAIKKILKELGAVSHSDAQVEDINNFIPPVAHSTQRSSNLAIRKKFSDRDKDIARREGFNFLSRFFENSLKEICIRHPELEQDFHHRDSDSFEASLYLNGQRVSHCGIWKSSGNISLGDICYSQSGISSNSCNESVSLVDDGAMLGFRSLMGGMYGARRDSLLTNEGMTEYFWETFIRPLK
tara:strand:+ start:84 stop:701 length:618 start_codon:yes stop_codon:yes gene_type:complete